MDRREFLQRISVGSSAALLPEWSWAADKLEFLSNDSLVKFGIPILQGVTTPNLTYLSIDVPKALPTRYELTDTSTGRKIEPDNIETAKRSYSPWRVDTVRFVGLELGHVYKLEVRAIKGDVLLDQRLLRSLDTDKTNTRLGLISCQLDVSPYRRVIWQKLRETRPDALFFLGDTVYGDIVTLIYDNELLWHRYVVTRRSIPFYRFRELIPVFAIWDDHDYGHNNTGSSLPFRADSLATFHAFMAQRAAPPVLEQGPTITKLLRAFGMQFCFLDCRYVRGEDSPQGKSFFGKEQLDWVFSRIQNNPAPTWFLQGSQTFTEFSEDQDTYAKEAPEEFEIYQKRIGALNRRVIFASGDPHYSEIMVPPSHLIGQRTYEITSSSMHSILPLVVRGNPIRQQLEKKENFIIADLSPEAVELTCISRTRGGGFQDTLAL